MKSLSMTTSFIERNMKLVDYQNEKKIYKKHLNNELQNINFERK